MNSNFIQEIFSNLSGEYSLKRVIENHGQGKGIAYFQPNNPNELLYKEEVSFNYHGYDNQISAVKEYKYIFENNGITKYFTATEDSLFYRLEFIDEMQYYSESFRQYEFKDEPAERIEIGEHRQVLQNLLVSSFLNNTVKAIGNHLCGNDRYNATYIFLNPDLFTLDYQVLGPQKDYNISTVFNRI